MLVCVFLRILRPPTSTRTATPFPYTTLFRSCTAGAPKGRLCPLAQDCDGRVTGAPETFPVKPPKPARPQRYGTIFWLERGREVLLVRRAPKGLLGGKIGREACRERWCQYV